MSRSQWLVIGVVGVVAILVLLVCACLGGYLLSILFPPSSGPPPATPSATPAEPLPTIEATPTVAPTPTNTPVASPVPSSTFTHTPAPSPTPSASDTPSQTPTDSPTPTLAPTATDTPRPTATPTETESPCISCAQARDYIGEYTCVCCTIVRTYYCSSCSGQPTFLNSHDPYRGYFTAVVWGDNRQAFINHFGSPPESTFRNRFSCFCGLMEYYAANDAPEITLNNPANACVDCTSCLR
jgi:hypothetical protein